MDAKKYVVKYERDEDGWWVATAVGVRGCHTQGRTIDQARRRVREALALYVTNAKTATIVDKVVLPPDLRCAMKRYFRTRKHLDSVRSAAQTAATEAVKALVKRAKISYRDAGELMGVSHQRILQLGHR